MHLYYLYLINQNDKLFTVVFLGKAPKIPYGTKYLMGIFHKVHDAQFGSNYINELINLKCSIADVISQYESIDIYEEIVSHDQKG